MKLTIGYVYHAFEFVKNSIKKIAPIKYSIAIKKWEPERKAEIYNLRNSPSVIVLMPTLR